MPKTGSAPQNLTLMNPSAAAIDIGFTMHMAAVNPERIHQRDHPGILRSFRYRIHSLSAISKSDQAYVEQKNGSVVRRIVGYHRYEGVEAAATLAELYRSVRLFVNFFQPSFKLLEKQRNGAMVKKLYSSPATPHQRLLSDARTAVEVRDRLVRMSEQLDPVTLLRNIRAGQQRLADIAHQGTSSSEAPDIESFLRSLRIAWTEGEVRPTAKAKPKLKRERRRPDPLGNVTSDLYSWFEAEPWRTGRELLERIQSIYLGEYPDGLLLTEQRRVKGWRHDRAY